MSVLVNPYISGAGGGGGGPFPAGFPIWARYKASDMVASVDDDDPMPGWTDSVNSNDAVAVSGQEPILRYSASGLVGNTVAVEFLGTTDITKTYFILPDMEALTEGEMLIWMKRNSGSVKNRIHLICGPANGDGYYPYDGLGVYDTFGSNARKNAIIADSVPPNDIWHCYDVYSKTNDWGMILDNGALADYNTGSNVVLFNDTPRLGADVDESFHAASFLGMMTEVIIMHTKLTTPQRTEVYNYFLTEYTGA